MEEVKELKIKVKTMDSHFIELMVKENTTIIEIKEMVLEVVVNDIENQYRNQPTKNCVSRQEIER